MKDMKNYAEFRGCPHKTITCYNYLQWRCEECREEFYGEETIKAYLQDCRIDEQNGAVSAVDERTTRILSQYARRTSEESADK